MQLFAFTCNWIFNFHSKLLNEQLKITKIKVNSLNGNIFTVIKMMLPVVKYYVILEGTARVFRNKLYFFFVNFHFNAEVNFACVQTSPISLGDVRTQAKVNLNNKQSTSVLKYVRIEIWVLFDVIFKNFDLMQSVLHKQFNKRIAWIYSACPTARYTVSLCGKDCSIEWTGSNYYVNKDSSPVSNWPLWEF